MSRQQHVNGRFVAVKGIHHIQGHPPHVVAPRELGYGVHRWLRTPGPIAAVVYTTCINPTASLVRNFGNFDSVVNM